MVSKIQTIVQYENLKNQINPELSVTKQITVENFIEGATCKYVDMIEQLNDINQSKGKLQNNLKQVMESKQWNAKYLSSITNIDPGTLSNILSNKAQPSMDNFLKIWSALNYPEIHTLFFRK
jgi:hypothetical protein